MIWKKRKLLIAVAFVVSALGLLTYYIATHDIAVLNPSGQVADKERNLILVSTLLMLIVVVPVFVLTFYIAWKYRAGNTSAKYSPELAGNRMIELTWWAIPSAIIAVLGVIAWNSSHDLDPFKPLESDKKPLTVQVVAMQWKWLFIYPEQGVASVNYLQFPQDRPINFEITSDAPMNSFWIPKLGGQIYAMPGMSTKLHLIANEQGSYPGSSANISGKGFAGMRFTARAMSEDSFEQWVQITKQLDKPLGLAEYHDLAKPSENEPPQFFSSAQSNLYDNIVMKYMSPSSSEKHSHEGHYINEHN